MLVPGRVCAVEALEILKGVVELSEEVSQMQGRQYWCARTVVDAYRLKRKSN